MNAEVDNKRHPTTVLIPEINKIAYALLVILSSGLANALARQSAAFVPC